jgi:hypothetical protein
VLVGASTGVIRSCTIFGRQSNFGHTKGVVCLFEIVLADETVMVVVDEVKGLLELGDLLLIEHGKDVRRGALSALLLGLATRCLQMRSDLCFTGPVCYNKVGPMYSSPL